MKTSAIYIYLLVQFFECKSKSDSMTLICIALLMGNLNEDSMSERSLPDSVIDLTTAVVHNPLTALKNMKNEETCVFTYHYKV